MLNSPTESAALSAPIKDQMKVEYILLTQGFRDLLAPRENLVLRVTEDFQDYQEEMEFLEFPAEMVLLVHLAHLEHLALAETSSPK